MGSAGRGTSRCGLDYINYYALCHSAGLFFGSFLNGPGRLSATGQKLRKYFPTVNACTLFGAKTGYAGTLRNSSHRRIPEELGGDAQSTVDFDPQEGVQRPVTLSPERWPG